LDIDDDVLAAAKELARGADTSAGKVLSDLARRGLNAQEKRGAKLRGGVPVFASRGEVITSEHVRRLMDEA
jgi:hypothetical protein